MKEAFPLHWPVGYKRSEFRIKSRFDQTPNVAQKFLNLEVERLGGYGLIVSTNIRIKNDGLLYSADMNKKINDPGVAVYFNYKGKEISMCCDQYEKVWENVYALGKGIEALRGMARWGVSDFLERAFTGFTAIPETTGSPLYKLWFEILEVDVKATIEEIKQAFRDKAKKHHPDVGGSADMFNIYQKAYEMGLKINK